MSVVVDADLHLEVQRASGDPVHLHVRGRDNRLRRRGRRPGRVRRQPGRPRSCATSPRTSHAAGWSSTSCTTASGSCAWVRCPRRGGSGRLTGSRRIRLGSLRGALTSARARSRRTEPVLPAQSLVPPAAVWPLAPTFQRRVRRRPGTTHDPHRGGGARLVLVREAVWPGERQPIFWLTEGLTIGSDPGCDVVLPGLAPLHARLVHDDADEWVVSAVDGVTRVHGAPVGAAVLRTGARVDLGPHHLVYTRDEQRRPRPPARRSHRRRAGSPAAAAEPARPARPAGARPGGGPAALSPTAA